MSWKYFKHEEWTDESKQYDAIVTEPPPAASRSYIKAFRRGETVEEISRNEVQQFKCFARDVIKSGGYAIILTTFDMLQEWYISFSDEGFVVMPYSYSFKYNAETDPKRLHNGFS